MSAAWERTSQSPPTTTDQCQKRQDEWNRTSQSPPTATDQCEKDNTSGSAQAKVHQQRLTNVKKDKTSGNAQINRYCWRCTFSWVFPGLNRSEPVWTSLNRFEPVWTGSDAQHVHSTWTSRSQHAEQYQIRTCSWIYFAGKLVWPWPFDLAVFMENSMTSFERSRKRRCFFVDLDLRETTYVEKFSI